MVSRGVHCISACSTTLRARVITSTPANPTLLATSASMRFRCAALPSSNPSTSRQAYHTSNLHPVLHRRPTSTWKGKGRAVPQHGFAITLSRHFHASSPRNAIPLIPATIGILKSASILTAVTAFSRILISFFPIGTIAALRMFRGVKWLSSDKQKPDAGPEAEDFWKMWCEGEKGIWLTNKEAKDMINGTLHPDGTLVGPDGRRAYSTPMPPSRFNGHKAGPIVIDPAQYDRKDGKGFYAEGDSFKRFNRLVKATRFYLPDLPPAAVSYYEALKPTQRTEVDALRQYWASLRMFKARLQTSRWIVVILLGLPCLLLSGVYLCGLERVPLTGRWRIILLTPEEEDVISSSLAGVNWYRSVINLLTTSDHPAPTVVPYDDWRWRWVENTLRQLEAATLADCRNQPMPNGPPLIPVPPAQYPLMPRPRVSSMLHSVLPGSMSQSGKTHLQVGPPYSLMIMDKDERNAFSYGFGGKGAGGIVVFTGLLDSILGQNGPEVVPSPNESTSFLTSISDIFSTSPPRSKNYEPTEIQTLHLASVLAHEMSHLLLSHHLETLSQQQVLWPSVLGLSLDLLRAFIWPLTFFLGPTFNDALANVGRTSADEMAERYGQIGFQWKHEYEADLAGLRWLALAGFDPCLALSHFSNSITDLREIQPLDRLEGKDDSWTGQLFKLWTRATHPSPEQRTEAVSKELERWKTEAGM